MATVKSSKPIHVLSRLGIHGQLRYIQLTNRCNLFFLVQYVLNKNRTMKLIATDIFLKWNTVYTCIHTQEAKNKTGKFKNLK